MCGIFNVYLFSDHTKCFTISVVHYILPSLHLYPKKKLAPREGYFSNKNKRTMNITCKLYHTVRYLVPFALIDVDEWVCKYEM
jgi:hypothetical protein